MLFIVRQVAEVRNQSKTMGANMTLANTVAGATKAMSGMNDMMNPQQLAKTLGEFRMQSEKMGITEEISKCWPFLVDFS